MTPFSLTCPYSIRTICGVYVRMFANTVSKDTISTKGASCTQLATAHQCVNLNPPAQQAAFPSQIPPPLRPKNHATPASAWPRRSPHLADESLAASSCPPPVAGERWDVQLEVLQRVVQAFFSVLTRKQVGPMRTVDRVFKHLHWLILLLILGWWPFHTSPELHPFKLLK